MRSRPTLYAALVYLALAILITYPLVTQLTTHIAGLPGNDSLEFVWSIWWFKHALLDLHTNPLNISVLNFPDGLYFPLLPAMAQSFLISLPVAAFISPVVAFNLTFLLSFPLCALAGYWLCFDLTQDRRAAFLGGLIWGFFPSKSAHALAGHLFQLVVFTLPIAVLFLLRVLRQPSRRNAILAGMFFAVAATIHPVNVAYFLVPIAIISIAFHVWDQRQRLITNPSFRLAQLKTFLLLALTTLLLTLPLFLPTLLSRDQLGFLVERGVVGFSLDLLTFILPAPNHPLISGTPLADTIRNINFFEFEHVAYLGLIPLALSLIALRWRWREGRVWLLVAFVTLFLSLGPLLRVGGQIVRVWVETDQFPILLPYAYLGQLPFFQWSRTPGRLNETTLFAIMILAAFGTSTLLSWIKNKRAALSIWLIACCLIPIEYLVRWPLPTTPVLTSPILNELAQAESVNAVMNFPVADNTINLLALLQQTYHQQPLIGGRVYRDQPGALLVHDFLSRTIIAVSDTNDIAPVPTVEQRAAAFNFFNADRIIYQPTGDPDGSARAALDSIFGSPHASDDIVSIYVPPTLSTPVATSFFIFGSNWSPVEQWQTPTRWFHDIATVYVFSSTATTQSLAFTAIPVRDLRRLLIKVNGHEVARFGVGDWADYQTPALQLNAGVNTIEFIDEDGAWQYIGDPRCQNGSLVAGQFPVAVPCDSANTESRDLSLAIQNLRLAPDFADPDPLTTFGDILDLLEVKAPTEAHPGQSLTLHFAYRASQIPAQDFTMFVHLLDSQNQLVAGNDSPPANATFPTTRWQMDQVIKYVVPLHLPTDLPTGQYTLEVGWYSWPSLETLPTKASGPAYRLGILTVKP